MSELKPWTHYVQYMYMNKSRSMYFFSPSGTVCRRISLCHIVWKFNYLFVNSRRREKNDPEIRWHICNPSEIWNIYFLYVWDDNSLATRPFQIWQPERWPEIFLFGCVPAERRVPASRTSQLITLVRRALFVRSKDPPNCLERDTMGERRTNSLRGKIFTFCRISYEQYSQNAIVINDDDDQLIS